MAKTIGKSYGKPNPKAKENGKPNPKAAEAEK